MTTSIYTEVQRELYIIKHGQEPSFRIKKWITICSITFIIYLVFGWNGVVRFISSFTIFGIYLHFLFRYKTNGWKKPWGIMKKVIKTPFD